MEPRIAHATFDLPTNPSTSHIATNHHTLHISNGLDCHHGGPFGFDKQHWTTVQIDNATNTVKLQLISPHGQNGYPGRLVSVVSFQLTPAGELALEYSAHLQEDPTRPENRTLDLHSTLVSLTNHTYWNLDGVLNSLTDNTKAEELAALGSYCSVKDHTLWLASTDLVELGNAHPVPTGDIVDLSVDPSDEQEEEEREGSDLLLFTSASCAGRRLRHGLDAIPGGFGYDHVYSLIPPETHISAVGIQGYYPATPHVATLYSPRTGIQLDLMTSEPALVLYAAGYVDSRLLPRTKSRPLLGPQSSAAPVLSATASSSSSWSHSHPQQPEPELQAVFGKFSGLCLEPIRFPDAIHHPDWAGMVTLHEGEVYRQRTVYRLSVRALDAK